MWNKLNGSKTYIGLICTGVLGVFVALTDYTWDDKWIQSLAFLTGAWTGVGIAHKGDKAIRAAKGE